MEEISGTVERITFNSEETGFCVIRVKAKGYAEPVTAIGNLASISVGSAVKMKGDWRRDKKFGRQFVIAEYVEMLPATTAGIEKYLGSGLVKGIGPAFAHKIVAAFGDDTVRVIEEQPERLSEVEGLGASRIALIAAAWKDQRAIKDIMIFLQGHGVSTAYATKIFKKYGGDSVKIVQNDPYRLADEIWGIGFKTADRIAANMGFGSDSPERANAGLLYVLNGFSDDGHCFAKKEDLLSESEKLLGIPAASAEASLGSLAASRRVIAEEDAAVYLPPLFFAETGCVKRLSEILATRTKFASHTADAMIAEIEAENDIEYDDIQKDAIRTAVSSKFTVLTGGPGTGKTTTTLAILAILNKLGARVLLAAPTGRAAKRLSEAACAEAKTIHRLLEYNQSDGYAKNAGDKLECDALIIDETSMVDILLFYNLLKALPNSASLILVGDADQLPSVGPGNVLHDIIDSGVASVVRLTRIFRQAMDSDIVMNAHRVNKGEMPSLKGGPDRDFFFIEEDDPAKIVETVRDLCVTRLPKYYGVDPVTDIQVLCPMIRGETGTANLNAVLRDALNPVGPSVTHAGGEFRLGDKVMQIKNNYDKNVFNGDIGAITFVDTEDRTIAIDFGGALAKYEASELDEVVPAYAATVHKSQGSEYPIVILPFTTQHYMMLQRNLLYTAITRAKKVFVLIGTAKAVAMAVANDKITRRNTKLRERLVEALK